MIAIDFKPKPDLEKEAKKKLTDYLQKIGQHDIERNVNELLLSYEGFVSRFDYFTNHIDKNAKERLLISGCSVGNELIIAKNFGFIDIYGTEVTADYIEIAKNRLSDDRSFHVSLYDGETLPYDNNFFSMICSGHIIEHTTNPQKYFNEHMRVLKNGGFLFIEFPNRYHHTELHTKTLSFEWLPKKNRNFLLKILSSNYLIFKKNRLKYHAVLNTLQPISIGQIKSFIGCGNFKKSEIIDIQKPLPGFVRMLIKKRA